MSKLKDLYLHLLKKQQLDFDQKMSQGNHFFPKYFHAVFERIKVLPRLR